MPDIANRTARETRLATLVRRAIGRTRDRIMAALGEPPNIDSISESLWADMEREIENDTRRAIALLFLLGMTEMSASFGVAPDPDRAGDLANDYASGRAAELAASTTATVRDQLRTAVRDTAHSGLTPRQAVTTINARFREIAHTQAELAGVTETTSANSAGEVWYKRLYESETGLALLGTWQTERDGKVCKRCRELHGEDEEVWARLYPEGPPAHPNCRCYLVWNLDPPDVRNN